MKNYTESSAIVFMLFALCVSMMMLGAAYLLGSIT